MTGRYPPCEGGTIAVRLEPDILDMWLGLSDTCGGKRKMIPFRFHQFLYGSDNYGVLMHDPESGQTVAIDAGDGAAYQAAIAETGWRVSHILLTHHHWDHTDGVVELAGATGATVYGPAIYDRCRRASRK